MGNLKIEIRENHPLSWAGKSMAGSRKVWTEALFLQHDPCDKQSRTLQLWSFHNEELFCSQPPQFSFLSCPTDDTYEWLVFTEGYVSLRTKSKAKPSAKTTHHLPFFPLVATQPAQGKHHTSKCGSHVREKAVALQLWKPAGHLLLPKGTRNILGRIHRRKKNVLSWTRVNCIGFTEATWPDSKRTSEGLF